MSDTLTSNENDKGHKSEKIESSEEDSSNLLVQLSNKTLALLNPYLYDSSSVNEESEPNAEKSYWQFFLSSFFGNVTSQSDDHISVGSSKQQRPRPRHKMSKPSEYPPEPSEDRLSAPYIEEHRPEQPSDVRRPLENTGERQHAERQHAERQQLIEATEHPRLRARNRFMKALAMSRIKKANRQHLRDTGNLGVLVFPSPISVPYMWARRDLRGRKAPPILFDALRLAITDSRNDENSYNVQAVFRIELEYGDVKWVVNRSGFDFVSLYFNLKQRKDLPPIPKIPSGLYRWFRTLFHRARTRHELQQTAALEKRNQLEYYLIQLIRTLCMHVSYELNEFLELSAISITRDMGWKGKEGYLESKVERFRKPICSFRYSKWINEWVIVRDSYIGFCSHISSTTLSDVFLFDKHFNCDKKDLKGLNRAFKLHGRIAIENSSRRIDLKGDSRKLNEFLESIQRVIMSSPWVRQHRFDAYAPIRENAKVKWYIDAKDYFFAVSEAILAAKSEIYIEDWWLSPELYLRRPSSKYEAYRLDRLLKRKAEEGVMIYIVVYKEVKYSIALDSFHTKKTLQELHKNIKVQRHPDHGPEGTMFWAHHEKIVVVDSRIAFIGGLDLCFGRYDTHAHELIDLHPDGNEQHTIWPGQDYSNPRIKDFQNVADYDRSLVDKSIAPRMPWHDISVGMVGPPARDVARHFVQRWNFIKDVKAHDKEKIPFLTPKGEYVATRDENKFKGTCSIQLLRSSAYWSIGINIENSIYNAYCHLIRTSKHYIYIENQFFVTTTENDPKYVIKNRIGECIVDRVIKAHANNEKFRIIIIIPLLPSFESDLSSSDAGTIRMVMHWQYMSICRGGKGVLEKIIEAGINPEKYITFYSLRGYDRLHCNEKKEKIEIIKSKVSALSLKQIREKSNKERLKDNSIQSASLDENSNSSPMAQNNITYSEDELYKSPTELKVPEASFNNGNGSDNEIKESQMQQQPLEDSFSDERTDSTMDRIGGEPAIPSGMEQTDLRRTYVTEEIYIHSKLMIVDDRYVIIGSANLNDRSMIGNRDSEIAAIIEDNKKIETFMNGKKYQASKFAYKLRCKLFREHLGLIERQDHSSVTRSSLPPLKPEYLYDLVAEEERPVTSILDDPIYPKKSRNPTKEDLIVMDPLSDEFYDYWRAVAHNNTETYRSVFRCVPDDNVLNWTQYKQFVPDPVKVPTGHVANSDAAEEEVLKKLKNIRGHLVIFPSKFLSQENLSGSVISSAITPAEIFT